MELDAKNTILTMGLGDLRLKQQLVCMESFGNLLPQNRFLTV